MSKILIVTDERLDSYKTVLGSPTLLADPVYKELLVERYSKATISLIAKELSEQGFQVDIHGDTRQLAQYIEKLTPFPYSAVINLSTGTHATFRAGQAAILLDMLRVPYSGSDPQTLLVLRDKSLSKVIAEHVGVKAPKGVLLSEESPKKHMRFHDNLYPMIVKPNFGCTSVGISAKVLGPHEGHEYIAKMLKQFPDGVIVEQFVSGTEVTVFIVGKKGSGHIIPLVLTRSDNTQLPPDFILSSNRKKMKRIYNLCWRLACASLSENLVQSIEEITWKLANAFRVRDYARFDFRVCEKTGDVYFIECNGQPGLDVSAGSIPTAINTEWFKKPNKLQTEFVAAFLGRIYGQSQA
ncbi:ATP-grasp domain-containing protein [Pseudodesulfovibrio sediminis]|uniref:D-alanine--D-alanine ligase n=1 Tax=Pseudodesulfovibrio sediminis TaxID=2810563 RepID=A0ABN6ERU9_9BACT|nr:ATP-grasp domain-containing protein [Pseudodesulfovibrio sediminis]BCS88170.1 D-alanine--D-alanine ligase [Pseudodesulfovibrio sediminis]